MTTDVPEVSRREKRLKNTGLKEKVHKVSSIKTRCKMVQTALQCIFKVITSVAKPNINQGNYIKTLQ